MATDIKDPELRRRDFNRRRGHGMTHESAEATRRTVSPVVGGRAPWLALWPGLCLTLVVYSLNMFGDAMRDLLDPRLRGGGGRLGADAARSV
jgi:hypothetical protein